jgi:hypothetical protein
MGNSKKAPDDPLSPNGFSSKLFGPPLWKFIHITSLNFPLNPTPRQSRSYFNFFDSLCDILPCGVCRVEFCKLIETGPLKMTKRIFEQSPGEARGSARLRVFAYSVALHHAVNVRTGKSPQIISRNLDFWTRKYAKLRS